MVRILPCHQVAEQGDSIAEAAAILGGGGLVAFPTETVYGLGALALDATAVQRIYTAKGRPATNPVIVHLANSGELSQVASEVPEAARLLADAFWPGPLTLVLPKAASVPAIVTAGGPTVAVRVPAHAVALDLLRAVGAPLAAPSANASLGVSPTTAAHVAQSLGDRVDLILDGGPCAGGIESTVLDLCSDVPRILRPGLIGPAEIAAVLGQAVSQIEEPGAASGPVRSPGQQRRHYAPRARVVLAKDSGREHVGASLKRNQSTGWLICGDETLPAAIDDRRLFFYRLPADPATYARGLYAALHDLDANGVEVIVVQMPPMGEAWHAVHDRLQRASYAPEIGAKPAAR